MGFDAKLNFVTDSFKYMVFYKFIEKYGESERVRIPYEGMAEDSKAVFGYASQHAGVGVDFDFTPYVEEINTRIAAGVRKGSEWTKRRCVAYMRSFYSGYCSRMRSMLRAPGTANGLDNIHIKCLTYHSSYTGDYTPPNVDRTCDLYNTFIYDPVTDILGYLYVVTDYPWQVLVHAEYNSDNFDELIWNDTLPAIEGHYARLSKKFPGQVSYFESPERMAQARRLCVKPGRYLKRFYPDLDPDVIRAWAAKATNFYSLKIAKTADEIVDVYTNGPTSCMSRTAEYYSGKVHPCVAYGDSDLAVAYISTGKKVTARAVVWPDRKLAGRIYGDYDRLIPLLKQEGYDILNEEDPTEDYHTFVDARIRLIHYEGNDTSGYTYAICPYIDGIEYGVAEDGWLKLTNMVNLSEKIADEVDYYKVQSDSGFATQVKKMWVADMNEYRTMSWVEDYCNYCVVRNEWNRYTQRVTYEIATAPTGSVVMRNTTLMGRQHLDAETYKSADGHYYMNTIPYDEVGGYKIPKGLVETYTKIFNLAPKKVLANHG